MKNVKPYYAVIFTSTITDSDNDYSEMLDLKKELVKKQDDFIGINSAKNEAGIIANCWETIEAITN